MVSEINDNVMQLMMLRMQSKMQQADTDGLSGLSKAELASVDTGANLDAEAFLKTLTEKFDTIDKNQDGQLSTDEILKSTLQQPLGPPPGLFLGNANSDNKNVQSFAAKAMNKIYEQSGSELKDKISDLASTFIQKLIDKYKDGGFSGLTSSLSSLV